MLNARVVITVAVLMLTSCSRTPARPRNVVLISIDTLRADRMSAYGGPRVTTPAIDALAERGVRFTNAYSSAPWTLPAHATMLTGRYPSSLSPNVEDALFKFAPLLSTVLKAHGFQTAAVTGGGFLSAAYGADAGFDIFKEGRVDDATAWLETAHSQPFFLFFHTYVVHVPYLDRRYVAGLDGGQLAHLYQGKMLDSAYSQRLLTCGQMVLTDGEKQFLVGLYDGGIAAADEIVGRLLAALEKMGAMAETMVVITSDHGEEFWDHGDRSAYHGHTLYNELMHVPLIWYEPQLRHPGSTRGELVGLVDLVPTIVTRLGFAPPAGAEGVDVSPLLDDTPWKDDRRLFVEAVRHGPPRRGVVSAAATLIVNGDPAEQAGEGKFCAVPVQAPAELYLASDPAQRQNRLVDQAALADALTRDLHVHEGRAAVVTPGAPRPQLDANTTERLRALGYAP